MYDYRKWSMLVHETALTLTHSSTVRSIVSTQIIVMFNVIFFYSFMGRAVSTQSVFIKYFRDNGTNFDRNNHFHSHASQWWYAKRLGWNRGSTETKCLLKMRQNTVARWNDDTQRLYMKTVEHFVNCPSNAQFHPSFDVTSFDPNDLLNS